MCAFGDTSRSSSLKPLHDELLFYEDIIAGRVEIFCRLMGQFLSSRQPWPMLPKSVFRLNDFVKAGTSSAPFLFWKFCAWKFGRTNLTDDWVRTPKYNNTAITKSQCNHPELSQAFDDLTFWFSFRYSNLRFTVRWCSLVCLWRPSDQERSCICGNIVCSFLLYHFWSLQAKARGEVLAWQCLILRSLAMRANG